MLLFEKSSNKALVSGECNQVSCTQLPIPSTLAFRNKQIPKKEFVLTRLKNRNRV